MAEHQLHQELKQKIVAILTNDDYLQTLWSGPPECDVFTHKNNETQRNVLCTVFLLEKHVSKESVASVCQRIIDLLQGDIQRSTDVKSLTLWISAGDNPDTYIRILRLNILVESFQKPVGRLLVRNLENEYYEEHGIQVFRYRSL